MDGFCFLDCFKICLNDLKDFKDFKTNRATDSVLYTFCIGEKEILNFRDYEKQ